MSGIFKAYDIRGIFPAEINEETAYAIGRAYVTLMPDFVLRKSAQRNTDIQRSMVVESTA